jgi:tetratricopeptide (TPR) repeat protein
LRVSLGSQAVILGDRGDLDGAIALHKEEERLCRELGSKQGLQLSLGNQGIVLKARGDLDGAMALYKEQEKLCRELGNKDGLRRSLSALAEVSMTLGSAQEAITYYEGALGIIRGFHNALLEGDCLIALGAAWHLLGEAHMAIRYYEQALQVARRVDAREAEAVALSNMAEAYHLLGRITEAEHHYKSSLAVNVSSTNYRCAWGLGLVSLEEGKIMEAEEYFEQCIALCHKRLDHRQLLYPDYFTLVLAQLVTEKSNEGLETLRRAMEVGFSMKELQYALLDTKVLGRLPASVAGLDEVVRLLEKAMVTNEDSRKK